MKLTIKILLIVIFLTACQTMKTNQICINEVCFDIEIADDTEERREGLMYKENLESDKGMLFIFNNSSNHSFWMKNTLIPLDIIWIDEDLKINWIEENVENCEKDPCPSYIPEGNSKYVLEINAGLVKKHGFKINDKVKIKLPE